VSASTCTLAATDTSVGRPSTTVGFDGAGPAGEVDVDGVAVAVDDVGEDPPHPIQARQAPVAQAAKSCGPALISPLA
jgi:hypothetical protein